MTNSATGASAGDPDAEPGDQDAVINALEQQLGVMFAQVRTLVRDRALKVHRELTPAGYTVLATLARTGPQHAGSLAATLYIDKSAISRILKQLTEFGLVERRPDPADRRALFVAATPLAVRRVHNVRDEHRRQLHEFLSGWDLAEVRQLTALLRRLNAVE